ncbi:MAG: hypothetical protein OHK0022_60970 [Roseiflexaceae bacterium]
MSTPDSLLAGLGFSKKHAVRGRSSIADLFPERGRCGIYVLHMADGSYYVGLSTDVTKRYQQHRQIYPDIDALSFKRVRNHMPTLREVEREVIYKLDSQAIPLLNKVHNSIAYHSSPLDLILSPEQQRTWLETGTHTPSAPLPEPLAIPPEKLARDRRKLDDFRKLPNWHDLAKALRSYIVHTIPAYVYTQGHYWSMSCLPATLGRWRAATINMSRMETFVISKSGSGFVNVALTVFSQHYKENTFTKENDGTCIEHTGYEAAGFDQIHISTRDYDSMIKVLSDPVIQKSARLMNLNLMRQRGSFFSNYHSPGLTDLVLALGNEQI